VERAAGFSAKVSVFDMVRVHEVLPLVGDKVHELVHCKRGWPEEGTEVNVRRGRTFWLSMELGVSASQFD